MLYTRRTFLGAFTTGFFGLGSYAFGYEPLYRLAVTRYDLALPRWPQEAPRLKVALLADIHAVDPWMNVERIAEIVAVTNALQPDMILLLGDYVANTRLKLREIAPRDWARPLGELRAPLGVHAILGNHDYSWHGGPEPVRQALERAGIEVYANRAQKIRAGGHAFWLSGTGSILAGYRAGLRPGRGFWGGQDDLPGTLAAINDDAPIIHMAHEPDMFPRIPARVALTVSGHTHGGQVRVPLLGRPVVPSVYGQRYAYGHKIEGGRHLLVSGGLGCSTLPVRFGVPPEVVLATLGGVPALPTS